MGNPDDIFAVLERTWPDFSRDGVLMEPGGQNHLVLYAGPLVVRATRYPTRAHRERLLREAALLNVLAGRLPLPVPKPARVFAEESCPIAYVAYSRLAGVPLTKTTYASLKPAAQVRVTADLLDFLDALHGLTEVVCHLPLPRRRPWNAWGDFYARVRRLVWDALPAHIRTAVDAHFRAFLARAEDEPIPVRLIHGDFGTANLLVDVERGRATGVLDWSDAAFDDPAVDLAALEASFGRAALQAAGRLPPEPILARMDFYRGTFALQEAVFGCEHGDPEALRAGIAGTVRHFSARA